ncbi:MAG: LysR family transcriptional regulator [Oscillospiraceae bacterium]|nr:LysR family transcriptional regulator [Oscillospiraceae bacterium]MBR2807251.1 LysR family transcriptional regulator [Oscillospiraceae bacterium]
MDIQQIKYAVAIYQQRSFTKAAIQLHVTQPLLSQQISALEQEIGFSLFSRTTRSVTPTQHGEFFCVQAAAVIREYDTLCTLVSIHSEADMSTLNIVTAPRISSIELPAVITEYYKLGGQMKINYRELEHSELLSLHDNMELPWDVAVLRQNDNAALKNRSEFGSKLLCRDPVVLLCHDSHPIRQQQSVSLSDLNDLNIVFGSPDSQPYHDFLMTLPEDYIKSRNIPIFSNSHNMMKELVLSGLAVALGNRSLAYHYGLSFVPIDESWSNDVYIIWKKPIRKAVIRHFIDYLTDYYSDWK